MMHQMKRLLQHVTSTHPYVCIGMNIPLRTKQYRYSFSTTETVWYKNGSVNYGTLLNYYLINFNITVNGTLLHYYIINFVVNGHV